MRRRDRGGVRARSRSRRRSSKSSTQVMKPGALLYTNTSGHRHRHHGQGDEAAAGRRRHAFLRPGQCDEAVRGRQRREERARHLGDGDGARPQDRQDQRDGRQWRRFRRQPQPRPVRHRNDHHARRGRAARAGRQGDGRFRLSDRAVRGRRSVGARHRLRRAASGAPQQNPNYRKLPIADRIVEPGRSGRRPAPAGIATRRATAPRIPTPKSRAIIKETRSRNGRPAAQLHRRGDPAPAAVRLGQRGLQDPRGGQGLPRQRHRRDVAARLRLPALPRRADVLGRRDRRARGLRPDRRLASAIRRALGAVEAAARAGRQQHAVPQRQAGRA